MFIYEGGFPLIAYYIEDKTNTQARIPFKCRIISEAGQFFTTTLSGLIDTGTNLTISTPKRLIYKPGAKVIIDGIMYSVASINPFIPDNVSQGIIKRKINANYIIVLQ
jgi:hypothetical protein